jgi:hypothetical protein
MTSKTTNTGVIRLYPARAVPSCRRLLAPLLAAAFLVALLPSLAAARPLNGVQIDAVSATDSSAAVAAQLSSVAAVHGTIVRVEVKWSDLQPRAAGVNDPAFLAALDGLMAAAAGRGMKVLMFVDRTPCWASTAPDKGDCAAPDANRFGVTRYPPQDPADYAAVSSFLVQRYGAKLAAFEIWNEPDQANEKYWAGPNKVSRYVALAKATYGPLKVINPQLQVLAGSFVGINGRWLQALYDAGIKGSYDGLAVHFYDLPLLGLKTTRAVQKANGDAKPLWLTEFGWTSCARKGQRTSGDDHPCVTTANQSKALGDVYRAVSRTSWIKAAIMYQLRDESAAYQFGLIDRAGRPKPSFAGVRRTLGAKRLGPLRRPTLRLTRRGGQVVVSGTGSIADTFQLRVYQAGTLRFRAQLRTNAVGTYALKLPAQLGTSGLRARVVSEWTGRGVTRRR